MLNVFAHIQRSATSATWPAMKMSNAAAMRSHHEIAMEKFTFRNEASSGQTATPENSANQPLVSGSGPLVRSSQSPPPAATSVQAQAALKPAILSA